MPQLDREAAFIPADLQNSGQATRMNAHRQDWACRTCVAGTNMPARNPACWRTVLRLCGLTTNLVFPGRPSPLPGWLQPNAGNDGLRERRGRPAIAVVHRSASPKVADEVGPFCLSSLVPAATSRRRLRATRHRCSRWPFASVKSCAIVRISTDGTVARSRSCSAMGAQRQSGPARTSRGTGATNGRP